MNRPPRAALDQFLLRENAEALDRYEALLAEDQALRAAEYEHPDPKRRRLRVACNDCTTPWCCNHRVDIDLVQALVVYRWAAKNAPALLDAALERGRQTRRWKRPLTDDEFFRRRMPCPFLVKGRCGIYAVRPHPCRTHYMASQPLKCRDELAPSETYAMDPDATIMAELRKITEDLLFFSLIEEVEPFELCELLLFIDKLAAAPKWRAPRRLGWDAVGERGDD